MNIMPRRIRASTKPSDPEALGELVGELRARDRELLKLQIELENARSPQSTEPVTSGRQIEAAALLLLAGDDVQIPVVQPDRLRKVIEIRAVVARAIELAGQRQFQAYLARGQSEAQRRAHEWRELIHQTVMTACALQKLNRRRATMAAEIRGKAHSLTLPCEFPLNPKVLLGLGMEREGPTHEFLRVAILEGITTVGEVAQLRGDNERTVKDAFGV